MSAQVVRAIEPRELVTATQMAVYFLRQGEVVGMPSETVYGLAGDAIFQWPSGWRISHPSLGTS